MATNKNIENPFEGMDINTAIEAVKNKEIVPVYNTGVISKELLESVNAALHKYEVKWRSKKLDYLLQAAVAETDNIKNNNIKAAIEETAMLLSWYKDETEEIVNFIENCYMLRSPAVAYKEAIELKSVMALTEITYRLEESGVDWRSSVDANMAREISAILAAAPVNVENVDKEKCNPDGYALLAEYVASVILEARGSEEEVSETSPRLDPKKIEAAAERAAEAACAAVDQVLKKWGFDPDAPASDTSSAADDVRTKINAVREEAAKTATASTEPAAAQSSSTTTGGSGSGSWKATDYFIAGGLAVTAALAGYGLYKMFFDGGSEDIEIEFK